LWDEVVGDVFPVPDECAYVVGVVTSVAYNLGWATVTSAPRANAVSDAVRGWHRDCYWDHQKYWQIMDNEMQDSYSGLSICS
jgi:hypothetical protein